MIRSMTAFARYSQHTRWGELTWELRSVNHRYLETSLRLPEALRPLEPAVRERLGQRLSRGKIEASLRYQSGDEMLAAIKLNRPLAERLLAVTTELGPLLGKDKDTALAPIDILRWPGVVAEPALDLEPIKPTVLGLLDNALNDLVSTREREGGRIAEMIAQRCAGLITQVRQVRARRPEVLVRIREKMLARLTDLPFEPEPGRLEQEMALVAQRLDVDEELDRLDAHLDEITQVLKRQEPVGRRLDFLMQELNREANTLSSKSADAETTRAAVEIKVLIEQMREQVQNIE